MNGLMRGGSVEMKAGRREIMGDLFFLYALLAALAGLVLSAVLNIKIPSGFIPLALFLMLYPMMLDVEPSKALRIVREPGLATFALAVNFVVAPLLVFGISLALAPKAHPLLMVGMVVFGLIPCGGMVPAYTGALGGNVTFSVIISAASLLLCAGIAPLWMKLFLGKWFPFPYAETASYLFGVIGFPFILAEVSRRVITKKRGAQKFGEMREKLRGCVRWGFMALLLIIFSNNGMLLLENPLLILEVMLPASIFLTTLLAFSKIIARITGWSHEDETALTISVSVKNTAVSIAFAASSIGAEAALAIGIIGPLVQAPLMLAYLALCSRGERKFRPSGGCKQHESPPSVERSL